MITDGVTLESCKKFYDAGDILFCKCEVDSNGIPHDMYHVETAVVNLAFSCEMGLKSFLIENQIDYGRTHELKILYKLLPSKIKTDLKNEMDKKFNISTQNINTWFFEKMNKISDNFYQWRYLSSRSNVSTNLPFLHEFARVIKEKASMQ